MEADAEHLIGNKAGCRRPYHHAGEQVAHQRGGTEPLRQRAEDEGQHEAGDDRSNQGTVVMHAPREKSAPQS